MIPRVKLTTSKGEVVIELYPDKAPKTVDNFLQYVRDGHYAGTVTLPRYSAPGDWIISALVSDFSAKMATPPDAPHAIVQQVGGTPVRRHR